MQGLFLAAGRNSYPNFRSRALIGVGGIAREPGGPPPWVEISLMLRGSTTLSGPSWWARFTEPLPPREAARSSSWSVTFVTGVTSSKDP